MERRRSSPVNLDPLVDRGDPIRGVVPSAGCHDDRALEVGTRRRIGSVSPSSDTGRGDRAIAATREYRSTLAAAKAAIQVARTRAVLAANHELIGLYWELGGVILERQRVDGWAPRSSSGSRPICVPSSPRCRPVAQRPDVHAGLRRRVARAGNRPTTRWAFAVASQHRAARQARRSHRTGVVRSGGDRARLVEGGAGQPDHFPAAPTAGHRRVSGDVADKGHVVVGHQLRALDLVRDWAAELVAQARAERVD